MSDQKTKRISILSARICAYIANNPNSLTPLIECASIHGDDDNYYEYIKCALDLGCMTEHNDHTILPRIEIKTVFEDKYVHIFENNIKTFTYSKEEYEHLSN